jgi:hypothetical protein
MIAPFLYQQILFTSRREKINTIAITPPAPNPQNALAAIKLIILWASAHHAVVAANITRANIYIGLLPIVSLTLPKSG